MPGEHTGWDSPQTQGSLDGLTDLCWIPEVPCMELGLRAELKARKVPETNHSHNLCLSWSAHECTCARARARAHTHTHTHTESLLARIRSALPFLPSLPRSLGAQGLHKQCSDHHSLQPRDLPSLFWCLQNNKKARVGAERPCQSRPLRVWVPRGGAGSPDLSPLGRLHR